MVKAECRQVPDVRRRTVNFPLVNGKPVSFCHAVRLLVSPQEGNVVPNCHIDRVNAVLGGS